MVGKYNIILLFGDGAEDAAEVVNSMLMGGNFSITKIRDRYFSGTSRDDTLIIHVTVRPEFQYQNELCVDSFQNYKSPFISDRVLLRRKWETYIQESFNNHPVCNWLRRLVG